MQSVLAKKKAAAKNVLSQRGLIPTDAFLLFDGIGYGSSSSKKRRHLEKIHREKKIRIIVEFKLAKRARSAPSESTGLNRAQIFY